MVVLILELPLFLTSFNWQTADNLVISDNGFCGPWPKIIILTSGFCSLVIRILFYLFVLAPEQIFRLSPTRRITSFRIVALLCLIFNMFVLQILLSSIFECMYMDYDLLSRNAWDALCLNGTVNASTNQTCVLADGAIGTGDTTSVFTLRWTGKCRGARAGVVCIATHIYTTYTL